jgi:pyruvate/2-oxoglutarate dehydrogenase complex dihydrolipoamide acyltransferase (E2) component
MATEILFPELGESVHEGQISKWLKKVGDPVKLDEPIVEIMTDKVNTELPSPATGILVEITVPEGGDVEVFHRMGVIEEDPEKAKEMLKNGKSPVAADKKPKEDKTAVTAGEKEALTAPAAMVAGDRRWYSPVVRAIARDNAVTDEELATIPGSGQGGRVNRKDIENYLKGRKMVGTADTGRASVPASRPTPAGPDQEVERLTGMRKMIAEHMVRSSHIPAVSTLIEVDVTSLVKFREANKDAFERQNGVKLTYTPFFIKAIAESLIEFPYVNSSFNDFEVTKNNVVHMGVAVSLGEDGSGGLIVPVIRNCESKNLVELSHDLATIAKKARGSALETADVQGGTFTLTNPGSYGATLGTPMINAPQAGIVGTYGIVKRPVIVDDMIAVRHIMNVVLTYDHRVVDGMTAGRFLQALKKRLEGFDFYK